MHLELGKVRESTWVIKILIVHDIEAAVFDIVCVILFASVTDTKHQTSGGQQNKQISVEFAGVV